MLDSQEQIRALDKARMLDALDKMPSQLMEGLRVGRGVGPSKIKPDRVLVCGVGGSAIGGDILCEWMSTLSDTPCHVSRSYAVPSSTGKGSLVLVASYSGDTEETLSMFEEARKRGAKLVAVSSGGRLTSFATKGDIPVARLPKGMMPRASVGYMLGTMIGILERAGLVSEEKQFEEAVRVLEGVVSECKAGVPTVDNLAKKMAHQLYGTIPVVVGYDISRPVAKRWANQFNENAKTLSFSSHLPELNHNEIVGWMKDSRSKGFSAIFLNHDHAGDAMKKRAKATRDMFLRVAQVHEVSARGRAPLAQMLSLMLFGDYVSVYLGLLGSEDPSSNEPIDELKAILSKK
jgi:glucose/mannose-6-phosphate isomerase